MATLKFYLSSRKEPKTERHEILSRQFSGKKFDQRAKTGIWVEPKYFENGGIVIRDRIKTPSTVYHIAMKERLNKLSIALMTAFQSADKKTLGKTWLQRTINHINHPEKYETKAKLLSFFEAYNLYLEKKEISLQRLARYRVLERALKRYELFRTADEGKSFSFTFESINADTIEDFYSFLRNEHNLYAEYPEIFKRFPQYIDSKRKNRVPMPRGNNTIVTLIKALRAFFHWASENEYFAKNPFGKYEGRLTEKYGTPYYITVDERKQIEATDFTHCPHLAVQRDIFVFQCLIGCRVSDLIKMQQSNVENGTISYIPRKTQENKPFVVTVPLNDTAMSLIARYWGKQEGGALFPFISFDKYNKAIKEIFTQAGITRLVTVVNPTTGEQEQRPLNEIASSHLARRTFIGNLYKKVKDPNLIGKFSGHAEGSRAFARYRDIDLEMGKQLVDLLN